MKGRGIALLAVLIVVVVGGIVFWKMRGSDKRATQAVTQGSGSAVAKPAGAPTAAKLARASVTVTDENGPVADAFVRFAPEDGEIIALKTGADGVAVADKLAAGAYEISASAAGHEPSALPRQELAAGDDAKLAITLKAGGRLLSGVVTDVSGGPIAGARIDAAKLGAMARPDRAVATALTGADGKYQVAVAEGQLLVAARSADYAAQSRIVDVGPSGATADFALVPGGVIEGIVVDEKTRAPVPGAIVNAERDSAAIILAETGGAVAIAGADGKFRMTGLRPGAYELDAVGDSRRSKSPTIVGLGIAEQVTDVEILVGKSPTIRGTVVDESNAPVKGARVMAMGPGGGEDTKADDKGVFAIEGLRPGKFMLFGSTPEHMGDPSPPIEVKDKDVENVVVRVRKGAKIIGRIEPPQACDVKVAFDMDRANRGGPMRMMRMMAPATSGPDGKFELGPVEEGKQKLDARCQSGDQGNVSVDVKPGANDVVLAVKPGGSIAGKVVDGEGKPVAGVSVMATPQEGDEGTVIVNGVVTSGVQALTNGAGAYEARGLAAGTYRMSALDRGRPMKMKGKQPKAVIAGAEKKTGVDLVVDRPNGVIKGIVTGPDGKPLADAWVSVSQDLESMIEDMANGRDEDGPRTTMMRVQASSDGDGGGVGGASAFPPALTDAQGRFEIRNLPKAKYEVLAEAQAGKLRGRLPKVEPDADVQIKAMGVTSLSGTVKSAAGPTPLFTIELDGPTRAQRTFTDGKFELGRVDPGNYVVKVTSADGNAEAKVTVNPGQPASVDIALVANAVVVGTIVDAAGKPIAGVPVIVIDDEGDGELRISMSGPPPTSGLDGKFRVEHKAGKGVLVVMTPPSPVLKRGLPLEAGKTHDVGEVRVDQAAPPP
ncbi:MAG: carboxypeptidase regulatory-like domain-containing protein [Myxococcota bacterium]|nr:carboxypeptidase regulatory-like domain-containing protein [Myxococcota bacterium]